jgi:hypothetical protein
LEESRTKLNAESATIEEKYIVSEKRKTLTYRERYRRNGDKRDRKGNNSMIK